jgi:hypothetical protein
MNSIKRINWDADVASVSWIAYLKYFTVNELIIPAPVMRWVVSTLNKKSQYE